MTTRTLWVHRSALALAVVSAGALAGCTTASPGVADSAPNGATASMVDVHAVDVDDDRERLTIATHSGLLSVDLSGSPEPAAPPETWGDYRGDVMGLTRVDDRFVFSGHPVAGSTDSPNVGVVTGSLDGTSWEPLALSGEADLHSMSYSATESRSLLAGLDSATGVVLTSLDRGQTWNYGTAIAARDLAVDPSAEFLIATTESGPQLSTDLGITWTVDDEAPLLFLVESGRDSSGAATMVGVDVEGSLYSSGDGLSWTSRGMLPFLPDAIGVGSNGTIAIVSTQLAMVSRDGGLTWSQVANLGLPALGGDD
ncbi:MAG: hypothetical protein K2X36_00380 [Microbacteriaceae bacterium]|nr:hypothetical protein [Microbacteriaceae bacterium]